MKTRGLLSFLVGFAACVACASADPVKWELRKESSGNVCHIQTSNTRPQRGDLLSSQDTHPKICEDAKKWFDSSLSDPKKCWSFDKASAKACEDDKVKIVPESAIRRN